MSKYDDLNRIISESEHIVFFGGAGVSTESGIPDFRSKDGLYNNRDVQFDRYTPEYLLSINCLEDAPKVFYEFYRQKMNVEGIDPNKAHYKLAEMEKAFALRDEMILEMNRLLGMMADVENQPEQEIKVRKSINKLNGEIAQVNAHADHYREFINMVTYMAIPPIHTKPLNLVGIEHLVFNWSKIFLWYICVFII